ncbi:S24 family peptidase [Gimesia chilikensis]|uniref:S24 family peptidase n=1 Tax=Gimesia chilikensis TaxID=2605989 RepID=UPI0021BC6F82|nr:S24 family peptidase [Gimesia chilikensis]
MQTSTKPSIPPWPEQCHLRGRINFINTNQSCNKGEPPIGWATHYIEQLQAGETVSFRPRGNSMKGKIESGQLCTVAPVEEDELQKGDIVLCKVNGSQYLHLIKAIQGKRFQIGNNIGRINGWISFQSIYGKLIQVEP